jgi:glutaredoxin/glutathione-dependent peroxiredoxin
MAIKVGEKLPEVTLKVVTEAGAKDVSTNDFFKGKKVVLFGLPGAFTPTCSAQHLPGYVKSAEELKGKGVDDIACLSVNDFFVMEAWGKAHGALGKVAMLADGNGELTRALGLTMDAGKFGMGTRSQRYAAIIDNGVVKELHVEAPSKFEVSSAEAILRKL